MTQQLIDREAVLRLIKAEYDLPGRLTIERDPLFTVYNAIAALPVETAQATSAERIVWQEEAQRYAQNAGYWRERYEALLRAPQQQAWQTNNGHSQEGEGASLAGRVAEADSRKVEPATSVKGTDCLPCESPARSMGNGAAARPGSDRSQGAGRYPSTGLPTTSSQAAPVAWRFPPEKGDEEAGWYIVDGSDRPSGNKLWEALYAAPPPDDEAVALLREVAEWYERDGSVGGCSLMMDVVRAYLSRKDQR